MKEHKVLLYNTQIINSSTKEDAVAAFKAKLVDQIKNMSPEDFIDSLGIGIAGVPKPIEKGFWDNMPIEYISDDNGKKAWKAKKFIDEFEQLVMKYQICIASDDHTRLESHTKQRCHNYILDLRASLDVNQIELL